MVVVKQGETGAAITLATYLQVNCPQAAQVFNISYSSAPGGWSMFPAGWSGGQNWPCQVAMVQELLDICSPIEPLLELLVQAFQLSHRLPLLLLPHPLPF